MHTFLLSALTGVVFGSLLVDSLSSSHIQIIESTLTVVIITRIGMLLIYGIFPEDKKEIED